MAGPRDVIRVKTDDPIMEAVQNGLAAFSNTVSNCPLIDGYMVKDAELLAAGTTQVSHRLGRVPLGWILVGISANSAVWEADKDSNFLELNCSANVTVSIWVF